jgi:hypothetical protein
MSPASFNSKFVTQSFYLYCLRLDSMTDLQLHTELSMLPPDLKKEVQHFIEFLKSKTKNENVLKQRKFGSAKGFFEMSKDFDEPLEDFKDYMQ